MPQVCSSKYYSMYPLNSTYPPLAPNPHPPEGAPQVAVQTSAQFRTWINSAASAEECSGNFSVWNSSRCKVPDVEARALKRGCVEHTQQQHCTQWTPHSGHVRVLIGGNRSVA